VKGLSGLSGLNGSDSLKGAGLERFVWFACFEW